MVTVIMSDPLNSETVEILKRHFHCEIDIAVATSEEIVKCIDMYFKGTDAASAGQTSKGLVIGDVTITGQGEDSVIDVVNFLITNAVLDGASDIHIEPMESKIRVRYRIDGILYHKTDLPASIGPTLASRIKVLCKLDIADRRRHQDGRIEARVLNRQIDLRTSTFASMWGESIVMRLLSRSAELTELNVLGFSPYHLSLYKSILDRPSGILLVTGPSGAGKTTTLYSSIAYLQEQQKKVITAEDPIEYTIEGVTQGQIDHRIDLSYAEFLKSMLRQDPDAIMIGEICDKPSAEAVIEASLTGHKVLTTFHTEDVSGALLRLLDMGVETFLISSTVVSVLSQRLVRCLCPKCRQEYVPDEHTLRQFGAISADSMEGLKFFEATGCHSCKYTGYRGRTAIHEILKVNEPVRESILQRQPSHQIRATARMKSDLISLREDGFYKATKGLTSLEEVIRMTTRNEIDEQMPRVAEDLLNLCEYGMVD